MANNTQHNKPLTGHGTLIDNMSQGYAMARRNIGYRRQTCSRYAGPL